MKDSYIIHLLQVIKANKGIWSLLSAGFQYSQIAQFIVWALEHELIAKDDNEVYHITREGASTLEALNKKFDRKGAEGWVSPLEEPTDQKNIFDIYIPKRRLKF